MRETTLVCCLCQGHPTDTLCAGCAARLDGLAGRTEPIVVGTDDDLALCGEVLVADDPQYANYDDERAADEAWNRHIDQAVSA